MRRTPLTLLSTVGLFAAVGASAAQPPNAGHAPLLHGATVFYDQNGDQTYQLAEEPATVTDAEGYYKLRSLSEPHALTLIGGHHGVFGMAFDGQLSTPKYATQITQATTVLNLMIEELQALSGTAPTEDEYLKSFREARNIFNRAFGITRELDVTAFGTIDDPQVLAINAALHSIMTTVASAYKRAFGEASIRGELIYYEVARSIARYMVRNRDRSSAYLNFGEVDARDFMDSVIRDVGPRVIALRARDKHKFDFDDIAYITAPDIARRATEAVKLVHAHAGDINNDKLRANWAVFQTESIRSTEHDITQGLGLHWTYHSDHNQGWASINKEYIMCGIGQMQSPVNILTADVRPPHKYKHGEFPVLQIHYGQEAGLHMVNNGHTLKVVPKGDNYILVNGERYSLIQFHFHQPSEEQIDGKHFDMVAHFVHANPQGDLAVVAVLFETEGHDANPVLEVALERARGLTKKEHKQHRTVSFDFEEPVGYNLNDMLPANKSYLHYIGSLTTPPCSEGVKWFVLKQPLTISEHQRELYAHKLHLERTNRNIQPLNTRLVYAFGHSFPEHPVAGGPWGGGPWTLSKSDRERMQRRERDLDDTEGARLVLEQLLESYGDSGTSQERAQEKAPVGEKFTRQEIERLQRLLDRLKSAQPAETRPASGIVRPHRQEAREGPHALVRQTQTPMGVPGQGSLAHGAGAPTMSTANDLAFWEAIKDSEVAADYKAYLEVFPDGHFAPLARVRAGY